MAEHLEQLLISDTEAVRFYATRLINLRASDLHVVLGDLPTPSLTVIGYGDGVRPGQVSTVVHELARTALRSGRSVEFTSGREWTGVVRASAMVGRRVATRLPRGREVNAGKMLGGMASAGGSLVVRGLDDLPASGVPDPTRVVDLWLVDDVAGVEAATAADQTSALDVVATVDWRLAQRWRWRWEREADAVVEVGINEDGHAFVGGLHDPVRLPPG